MAGENPEVRERMRARVKQDLAARKEASPDLSMWGPQGQPLPMPGGSPGGKGVKESEAPEGSPAPEPTAPKSPEAERVVAEPDSRAQRDFKEMGDRLKKANTDLEAERKEKQELQERLRKFERDSLIDRVVHEERPQQYADWDLERQQAYLAQRVIDQQGQEAVQREIADRIASLEADNAKRDLHESTGLSGEQLEAALTVQKRTGGTLSPTQLVYVTRDSFPDLFPQPDQEVPTSHRVNRPAPPGERRAKPDEETELRETVRDGANASQTRRAAFQQLVRKQIFGR